MRVSGKWCYLYRAVDRDGNLVDSMLSKRRDMVAAKRLFKGAKDIVGHAPERVTTDGHIAYPRAIRRILGRKVIHRTNRLALIKLHYYRMEQDHRGIKQRYYSRKSYAI